jgi:L,D-transpeptidase catalytic domain
VWGNARTTVLLALGTLALAPAARAQTEPPPAVPPPLAPEPEPRPEPAPEPAPGARDGERQEPRRTERTFVSNERTRTYFAYVRRDSRVYRERSRKSRRVGRVGRFTYYGLDDVVIVLQRRGRWTKVRFPGLGRRVGWMWSGALSRPRVTRLRVTVHRRRHLLTVHRRGKRIFSTPVGVGASGSPTPAGRYYLRERLVPRDRNGIYGALAFGTSAYSPYRTDWPGGGQVGIHGTNQPGLIPGSISNGCIRLRNRAVRRLGRIVHVGTPLRVR